MAKTPVVPPGIARTQRDPWNALRRFTPARIGLGGTRLVALDETRERYGVRGAPPAGFRPPERARLIAFWSAACWASGLMVENSLSSLARSFRAKSCVSNSSVRWLRR